jgi:TPR repeat protein
MWKRRESDSKTATSMVSLAESAGETSDIGLDSKKLIDKSFNSIVQEDLPTLGTLNTNTPGNPRIMVKLAYCHQKFGDKKTSKTLFSNIETIAKDESNPENLEAKNSLGCCYQYGIGTKENLEQAGDLFLKTANAGNIRAQYNYGFRCEKNGNLKDAITFYKMASDQGSVMARCNLGLIYFNEADEIAETQGKDKALDLYKSAFELYKSAADIGDIKAQYSVGVCFFQGFGTGINYQESAKYFGMAEAGGDKFAGVYKLESERQAIYKLESERQARVASASQDDDDQTFSPEPIRFATESSEDQSERRRDALPAPEEVSECSPSPSISHKRLGDDKSSDAAVVINLSCEGGDDDREASA